MAINKTNKFFLCLSFLFIFLIVLYVVRAIPSGPDAITQVSNETKGTTGGLIQNQSEGGGYIYTITINGTTQNSRWKAYVGNVTGKLTLDDATGSTIYDWTLTASMAGEVYASRSSSVSWSNINCTWGVTGNNTNRTVEENENYAMNHTSADDNITATFDGLDNAQFEVGTLVIPPNYCYTTNTYIGNVTQSTKFEEIILYDNKTDPSGGNVVYATIVENGIAGFDNNLYDFQMIVPENGAAGWTMSTAYYFYVEVS